MRFEMNSKLLGCRLVFCRPGGGHIYVNINNQPGSQGNQLCAYGSLWGSAVKYTGSDPEQFAKICRNWYRGYCRIYRAMRPKS